MSPTLFVLLSLCGGLGAGARYALDSLIQSRGEGTFPWGTVTINLTGSFALGVVTGLVGHHLVPTAWQPVLGVGFLGGYTTFSTASLESVRLLQDGRVRGAALNVAGTLVGSVVLAMLGLSVGALLS